MSHHHPTNGLCEACEATGLPYVQARDLKAGLLIQTRFRPLPGQEYSVGEVGDVVEKGILDDVTRDGEPVDFVCWKFAWYRVYRDGQILTEISDGSHVTEMVLGYSEYPLLEPGTVQRPLQSSRHTAK